MYMESKRSKYILIALTALCVLLISITSLKDGIMEPLRKRNQATRRCAIHPFIIMDSNVMCLRRNMFLPMSFSFLSKRRIRRLYRICVGEANPMV